MDRRWTVMDVGRLSRVIRTIFVIYVPAWWVRVGPSDCFGRDGRLRVNCFRRPQNLASSCTMGSVVTLQRISAGRWLKASPCVRRCLSIFGRFTSFDFIFNWRRSLNSEMWPQGESAVRHSWTFLLARRLETFKWAFCKKWQRVFRRFIKCE